MRHLICVALCAVLVSSCCEGRDQVRADTVRVVESVNVIDDHLPSVIESLKGLPMPPETALHLREILAEWQRHRKHVACLARSVEQLGTDTFLDKLWSKAKEAALRKALEYVERLIREQSDA